MAIKLIDIDQAIINSFGNRYFCGRRLTRKSRVKTTISLFSPSKKLSVTIALLKDTSLIGINIKNLNEFLTGY